MACGQRDDPVGPVWETRAIRRACYEFAWNLPIKSLGDGCPPAAWEVTVSSAWVCFYSCFVQPFKNVARPFHFPFDPHEMHSAQWVTTTGRRTNGPLTDLAGLPAQFPPLHISLLNPQPNVAGLTGRWGAPQGRVRGRPSVSEPSSSHPRALCPADLPLPPYNHVCARTACLWSHN